MLSAVLRTGQNPLATDTNAVPDELQEKPHHEQHLRSAAFLPWQERRERSDAATRSNSEQRKREYVESAPQHQERLAAQMTALQSVISEQTASAKHSLTTCGPLTGPSMPSLLQQRSDLQAKLPRGAFSDCPICALVQGVPQDGYVHCVTGDACNKPSSYAGVAKATRDLEQRTETYLQVHDMGQWVDQQLRLKALASGKGQAPTRLPSISLSIDMAQLQLRGLRGLHEQRMAAAKLKYRTQVEQLTNDVHELGLQRDRMGQSDNDTRAASNAIKAKLRTARHLLIEAALYQALGSGEDAAADSMTEEQH
ncbi:hypothetical protein QJQ45_002015 [Haematococcus lacustris]|nr:hypothetical protein QJQ45_002015 [Haematococcus lacustris]